jgi:hypothetical protein
MRRDEDDTIAHAAGATLTTIKSEPQNHEERHIRARSPRLLLS